MIAYFIKFLLHNLPALLFIVALLIAATKRVPRSGAERFLSWILLLPIGVTGVWAGAFHVFFPTVSAKLIGWQVSPFQFEVGMADLAIGVTACVSFWRDLDFKAAAVSVSSIFLLGDAVGHVQQMLIAGNFAPGNAGVPFYMDIICPLLSIALLAIATRQKSLVQNSWIMLKNSKNCFSRPNCSDLGIKVSSDVNSLIVAKAVYVLEIGPRRDFFNTIHEFCNELSSTLERS